MLRRGGNNTSKITIFLDVHVSLMASVKVQSIINCYYHPMKVKSPTKLIFDLSSKLKSLAL